MLTKYSTEGGPIGLPDARLAIFMPRRLLAAGGILFSGWSWESACVRPQSFTKSLLARYLINRLWEFHQIYNLGAVGRKDELIRFWGQEVKGQGYSEKKCLPIDCSPLKTI